MFSYLKGGESCRIDENGMEFKLFERGYLNICGLYFLYIIYTDATERLSKLTLREVMLKITIVNMKE